MEPDIVNVSNGCDGLRSRFCELSPGDRVLSEAKWQKPAPARHRFTLPGRAAVLAVRPLARVRARLIRPAPCLEGGRTYRPGLDGASTASQTQPFASARGRTGGPEACELAGIALLAPRCRHNPHPLGVDGVVFLVQSLVGALPRVDGAAHSGIPPALKAPRLSPVVFTRRMIAA